MQKAQIKFSEISFISQLKDTILNYRIQIYFMNMRTKRMTLQNLKGEKSFAYVNKC